MTYPTYTQAEAASLWSFACCLYRQPGVMQACLSVQDQHGLAVNWLLACCWLGWRGQRLDYSVIQQATAWQQWHLQVTLPLRQARCAVGQENKSHSLYARLKDDELAAEREELQRLQLLLLGSEREPSAEPDARALAGINLRCYLQSQGLSEVHVDLSALSQGIPSLGVVALFG
ncbi:TIGR02444 family protein [Pokkaliibacter plantistimulans]|uniref:TIGR02444 family protein n=1 Tax=Pokkaliibacter plantistimulans TaxID=1635171 RepID=UPI001402818D|nr:TIGR02444 family protein [Pokkaliibacter plantistimulans]